jgi:hypothetical protein
MLAARLKPRPFKARPKAKPQIEIRRAWSEQFRKVT